MVGKNDKTRATIIGTSPNFIGLGIAPPLSGLLAQYMPWPLHLSFIVYILFLCAVAVVVSFTQETVRHTSRPPQDSSEADATAGNPRAIRRPRYHWLWSDGASCVLHRADAGNPVARPPNQKATPQLARCSSS
jgi:hypothetical protein